MSINCKWKKRIRCCFFHLFCCKGVQEMDNSGMGIIEIIIILLVLMILLWVFKEQLAELCAVCVMK